MLSAQRHLVTRFLTAVNLSVNVKIKKLLDRTTGPVLYKAACAYEAQCEGNTSMLNTRTYKQHPTKWQPCAAMYPVVCSLGLTLSAINTLGGRLGQEQSIDSRNLRH